MNKTKRTLIVSSIVMMLVLVIAIVSATAAWFSNFADSKQDGFTIDSTTMQESVSIGIDETVIGYGKKVWPAVATKGYSSNANGTPFPLGQQLKSETNDGIDRTAQCAVFYFPIAFVGTADNWTENGQTVTDGRKSIKVSAISAILADVGTDGKETQISDSKNYIDDFNVEMSLVYVNMNENGENVASAITSHSPLDFNKSGVSASYEYVYFHQPTITDTAKDVSNDFYMLIMPGVKYYVKAVVYFNTVDEECDVELLSSTQFSRAIQITFKVDYLNVADVNIRNLLDKLPFSQESAN